VAKYSIISLNFYQQCNLFLCLSSLINICITWIHNFSDAANDDDYGDYDGGDGGDDDDDDYYYHYYYYYY